MKFTVTTTSQTLRTIMWATDWATAVDQEDSFTFTFQNNGSNDIYIENWDIATANSYIFRAGHELEISYKAIENLQLVTVWSSNLELRLIVT